MSTAWYILGYLCGTAKVIKKIFITRFVFLVRNQKYHQPCKILVWVRQGFRSTMLHSTQTSTLLSLLTFLSCSRVKYFSVFIKTVDKYEAIFPNKWKVLKTIVEPYCHRVNILSCIFPKSSRNIHTYMYMYICMYVSNTKFSRTKTFVEL